MSQKSKDPKQGRKQDAIQLLKDDHKTVRQLLQELTETTPRAAKKRPKLLERIYQELKIHTEIEEKIFYPAFVNEGGDEAMYYEAREEHRAVDKLVLPDLRRTDPTSEKFSGRAKVLRELVEHHADEEEAEMFPKARKQFTATELAELGQQMRALKKKLKKRYG